jgi:hypothetical protein
MPGSGLQAVTHDVCSMADENVESPNSLKSPILKAPASSTRNLGRGSTTSVSTRTSRRIASSAAP